MAAREAELLPVPYFNVVFTLPSAIGDIAYQNKAAICDLLFNRFHYAPDREIEVALAQLTSSFVGACGLSSVPVGCWLR